MATLTQVVNGEYVGADKYTIQDAGDGKSTVTFSPDQVLKEGTPVGAELLNEIQKNGLYYLVGTHRVSGQESIYDCTLVGIDTFDFTQLNVLFKPNTKPTQSTVKLNISGKVYTLTGKILSANQVGLVLVKSESKAYTWANQIEIVNDLTTGGATNALSGEMGKKLGEDKQDKTDSDLKTNSKKIVGAINESYDFTIFSAISGSSNLDSSLSEYKKDTFKNTLKALILANKLPKMLYITPKDFSDLDNFQYQNSQYEITILYAYLDYGVKFIAVNPDMADTRFCSSWNLSDSTKIYSVKLDGYNVGVNKDIPHLNKNEIKSANTIYIDRSTNKLYYCYKEAPATVITPNADYFIPASNLELAKGKTIIALNDDSVVEKYDNGLMIQYGVWKSDASGGVSNFPAPFVRGLVFPGDGVTEDTIPYICGATPYGSSGTAVSVKVLTTKTNLTQISFVESQSASIAYTAIGYWK